MKETFPECPTFTWQSGYGIFAVSSSGIDDVKAYIADQPRHHQQRTFQNELRTILRLNGMDWDEHYIWE